MPEPGQEISLKKDFSLGLQDFEEGLLGVIGKEPAIPGWPK
jgi:hypothetical protein